MSYLCMSSTHNHSIAVSSASSPVSMDISYRVMLESLSCDYLYYPLAATATRQMDMCSKRFGSVLTFSSEEDRRRSSKTAGTASLSNVRTSRSTGRLLCNKMKQRKVITFCSSISDSMRTASIGRKERSRIGVDVFGDGDTIAAVVTGQGGAVSIVRMSGPYAVDIAQNVFRLSPNMKEWKAVQSHKVLHGYIFDTKTGADERTEINEVHDSKSNALDEVLLFCMLAPRSYTAEDVVEIHCHGGAIMPQRILSIVIRNGCRLAKKGEFTYRAVRNGRIDLTQAESVADIVNSKTIKQADMALAGIGGSISYVTKSIRQRCLDIMIELEAQLDFDEELDLEDKTLHRSQKTANDLNKIVEDINTTLSIAERNQVASAEYVGSIVGRPNVGKSSLLNALAGNDKAIVTDIPGTTRDIVEANIIIDGVLQMKFLDTAGIRPEEKCTDDVERIGISRSYSAARIADLVLFVIDVNVGITAEDVDILLSNDSEDDDVLLVLNKVDEWKELSRSGTVKIPNKLSTRFGDQITLDEDGRLDLSRCDSSDNVVAVSARNQTGIHELHSKIRSKVLKINDIHAGAIDTNLGNLECTLNQRQKEGLLRAKESLLLSISSISQQLPFDFWLIDIRDAVLFLGEIDGSDIELNEELLDGIFSKFCIGK